MTEQQVRNIIKAKAASASYPLLEDYEIEILVEEAKVADSDGISPSTAGWIPTWNINAAISVGWELKAGKCAGDYNFTDGDQKFDRSSVQMHCLRMAKRYREMVFVDVKTPSLLTVPLADDVMSIVVEDEEV